jgi:hypothetical protein
MVDYMQKAREALTDNGMTAQETLATTLEALDRARAEADDMRATSIKNARERNKAEAERDALMEKVKAVVPDAIMFVGARWQSDNLTEVANRLLPRLKALIQPEPDPLVKIAREMVVADGTVRTKNQQDAIREGRAAQEAAAEHERRLRASLARHGLAVKEVG